jgi:hypothetical protein
LFLFSLCYNVNSLCLVCFEPFIWFEATWQAILYLFPLQRGNPKIVLTSCSVCALQNRKDATDHFGLFDLRPTVFSFVTMSSVPSSSKVLDLFHLGFASPAGSAGVLRSPATPVLTGKLDTGGGLFGNDSAMGIDPLTPSFVGLPPPGDYSKRVGLMYASKGELMQKYCCGLIGGGTKMCICIWGVCGITGHKTKKFNFDTMISEDEKIILICCVPRKARKDGTFPSPEVYIAPMLLASSFAGDLPSLITRTDSVDHWVEWFTVGERYRICIKEWSTAARTRLPSLMICNASSPLQN